MNVNDSLLPCIYSIFTSPSICVCVSQNSLLNHRLLQRFFKNFRRFYLLYSSAMIFIIKGILARQRVLLRFYISMQSYRTDFHMHRETETEGNSSVYFLTIHAYSRSFTHTISVVSWLEIIYICSKSEKKERVFFLLRKHAHK